MDMKEQALRWLFEAQFMSDTEEAHIKADDALCELLVALGYEDVVDEWRKVKKWYA